MLFRSAIDVKDSLDKREQKARIKSLELENGKKEKALSDDEDDTVITGFTFERSEYNGDTEPSKVD